MNNELNWAKQRADLVMKSVGFEGINRTQADDTVRDTIAAALQQVADECADTCSGNNVLLSHAEWGTGRTMSPAIAIRARFPRCSDAE